MLCTVLMSAKALRQGANSRLPRPSWRSDAPWMQHLGRLKNLSTTSHGISGPGDVAKNRSECRVRRVSKTAPCRACFSFSVQVHPCDQLVKGRERSLRRTEVQALKPPRPGHHQSRQPWRDRMFPRLVLQSNVPHDLMHGTFAAFISLSSGEPELHAGVGVQTAAI